MLHSDNNALILEKPTSWKMDSSVQPLVPTKLRPSNRRPTGTYNSSEVLPTMGLLFDYLLSMIRSAHENRQYQPGPFVALWAKTCKRLEKEGSATAYESWKLASILKNLDAFQKLDVEIAEAWRGVEQTQNDDGHTQYGQVDHEKLKHLQLQRNTLKPKATITIDGALEIAIAFWIEARNAYNASDEQRAMHALLQCSFYLGTTHSPVTEAESKRATRAIGVDNGPRDAIAEAALEVMEHYQVAERIKFPDALSGKIAQLIQNDPKYDAAVAAFASWNVTGQLSPEDVGDRMHQMMTSWGEKKAPYAKVHSSFNRLLKKTSDYAPNKNR